MSKTGAWVLQMEEDHRVGKCREKCQFCEDEYFNPLQEPNYFNQSQEQDITL